MNWLKGEPHKKNLDKDFIFEYKITLQICYEMQLSDPIRTQCWGTLHEPMLRSAIAYHSPIKSSI